MKKHLTFSNITALYLFLMFTVFLLCFGTEGYSNIFAAKTTVFTVISLAYIGSMSVGLTVCAIGKRKPCFKIRTVHVFAVLYCLVSAVSALISDRFPHTLLGANRFEGAFTICIYTAVFILLSLYGRLTRHLYITLAASVTAFDTVCILQLFGLNPFDLYPRGMTFYDAGRLYRGSYIGMAGNAGFSAAILCLVIPLFAVRLIRRDGNPIISAVPLVLSCAVAAFMDIDAAVVGVIGAAVIAVPIVLNLGKKGVRIYFATAVCLAVLILTAVRYADIGGGTLHELHLMLNGTLLPEFGSGRIGIWQKVLSVIGEAPILGKGPDTMILEGFEPFSRYYPELGKTLTSSIDNAHNEYLNILYHQGVLGLVSYLGIIISAAAVFMRRRTDPAVLALGIGALAYLIQALFGIGICISSAFFWIFLGLVCSETYEDK